ncbi:MAG: translocation/assembly module TamB domain-containing protein, partial [Alphaproteobacteria bacterium]
AGEVRVAAVDQRVDLRAGEGGRVTFTARGDVAGLAVPAGDGVFEEHLTLAAAGAVTPGGPFALERLALDGRTLTLGAEATGDLGAGSLEATAGLRLAELAEFRAFSPAAPSGAFALDLTAALADGFTSGRVRLEGGGRDLAELPPAAQALLGAAPTLAAEARLAATTPALRLERLTLAGAAFELTADGTFDPAPGGGAATAAVRIPDLAPVGDALGQPLAGAVTLDLDARGDPDDVDAAAVLTATGLEAAGQSFERVRAALDAAGDPRRLTGRLDAAATKPAGEVTLASAYVLTGERVDLDELRVRAPGLALDGGLDVTLAPLALDGGLTGGSRDLAGLGRWLDLPLAGALDLEVALASAGGQTARIDASTRGLEAAGLALERLALTATASEVFATPRLEARADLAGLATGASVVDRAEATVAGGLDALAVTVDAAGRLPQSFDLAAAADLALAGGPLTVTLTRLDGELEELPVRLVRPATFRMDGATLALEGLALDLDTGRLAGDARLGPERIDGLLELEGLRLERLGALGVPPLAGELATTLRLDGTRRAPVLDGAVALGELRPPDSDGAAAALDLDWRLADGALDATLATAGFGEPALGVEARLPLRFALEPFTLDVPQPLPLDVAVTGAIDLARAAGWYGFEDRVVEGRLASDLEITGNAAAPQLDGGVTLADGRYVDLATGVLLDDLRAELAAEGQRLVVRELAASDGAEGRLSADGAIDFADASPAFDVAARLSRFAVLQREALFIVMGGEAGVAGRGADLDVQGDFTVEQGEIFLEAGGGAASFASLDVVDRAELAPDGEDADAAGPGGTVDLDVTVDVPGRLFVRGRGLVSEWGGDLEIGGTAAAPSIEGAIAYRRGYFDLFDRRFELRRGELQFTGATPPDPFLDVEAAVTLPESTAILRANGPALDPEFSVASEPDMPEDEILSRLLFSRDQAQLNAVQALRVAAAVQQLRGGGPSAFDRLRNVLGIDTLEVGGETMEDASVQAGAYVREDVFVAIERGLESGSSGARVEVELTPRITVETRVREDSTSSVGLRWSYDY